MPFDPNQPGSRPWEKTLHEAAARIEDEVRRVVRLVDEDVVPDVRRSSSAALRAASLRLAELARHLDDTPTAGPDAQPGKPPAKDL